MLQVAISSPKTSKYIAALSDKKLTARDIQNLKVTGENEEVTFVTVPSDILEKDPGAPLHLTTLMVMDGNANDQVIAHVLLRSESRQSSYNTIL